MKTYKAYKSCAISCHVSVIFLICNCAFLIHNVFIHNCEWITVVVSATPIVYRQKLCTVYIVPFSGKRDIYTYTYVCICVCIYIRGGHRLIFLI